MLYSRHCLASRNKAVRRLVGLRKYHLLRTVLGFVCEDCQAAHTAMEQERKETWGRSQVSLEIQHVGDVAGRFLPGACFTISSHSNCLRNVPLLFSVVSAPGYIGLSGFGCVQLLLICDAVFPFQCWTLWRFLLWQIVTLAASHLYDSSFLYGPRVGAIKFWVSV